MSKFPKQVKFGNEARELMLKGINIVADSVGSTLGPKGRNVAINQPYGAPLILHDGVSVAKAIDLKSPWEDMGAQLVKSTAQKTNDKAGDGTTTATVIAQHIANKGIEMVTAGSNPMTLKDEIDTAAKDVLLELKKLSKKVSKPEEIEQVATISSANPEIGKLVSEAITKVGKDGVVTVEEGKGTQTVVDYTVGMEIDRGYMSPQFVTNAARTVCEIEDAYILISNKRFTYNYEIVPFVERFMTETKSKNLVMIVEDIQDEALASMVLNHIRGAIKFVAIKAPSFGMRKIDELWDIATITGGTPILHDSGRDLDTVQISELGRAGKVVVTQDKTTIFNGKGLEFAIKDRIKQLSEQVSTVDTGFELDVKKERLAKLSGGVAVIHVGASTEVELRERKERVIDAVNATRAAIEEGVVAGGEITLLSLRNNKLWEKHNNPGGVVLRQALERPFKVLTENAGMNYADAWSKVVGKKYPFGIDVTDGQVKDMIKSGIIDPAKVTRCAIENAVSVATMALTTSTLISEPLDEEEK